MLPNPPGIEYFANTSSHERSQRLNYRYIIPASSVPSTICIHATYYISAGTPPPSKQSLFEGGESKSGEGKLEVLVS